MEHRANLARVFDSSAPEAVLKSPLGQLIVLETNAFARAAVARFLAPLYQRVHAYDCCRAAESVLATQEMGWTDLIVAESLPEAVSGCRIARSWRARYPQLRRVVLATGSDSLPEETASMDAVFRKPFNVQELGLFLSS